MRGRATYTGRRIVPSWIFFLSVLSVITWGTTTWASTRIGDMELQMWYRMRHTFHTDGGDHFDWVQWRNEVFGWLIYENVIKNGKLFDKAEIPWIRNATLNARYRFRADPVYTLREHFDHIYDDDEKRNFLFPENGFRDLFLDLDFGEVGPGFLTVRAGNQQIVWGESDLFRSLDIINPLRIDQNTFVGEKFDEFRSPIWALKALYTIGNVGESFSSVAVEPWYSPRWRAGSSDLIADGVFRLPFREKGCLDSNNNLIPFDIVKCSQRRADGSRVFVPYRQTWLGRRRIQNPWSIFSVHPNRRVIGADDGTCLTVICSPDVFGHRASLLPLIRRNQNERQLSGINDRTQAGGFRILASSWFGMDFTLNYMILPAGPSGTFDLNRFLVDPRMLPPGSPPTFKPEVFYGDPDIAAAFGIPAQALQGDFQAGLRRCLSDGGKAGDYQSKDRGYRTPTFLIGADLRGFNHPDRFGPNGALGPDGNPKAGKHNAARPPITLCLPALHEYYYTHVAGFSATYNDFDYTGAVFRLEQSYSTKEVIRALAGGFGARATEPFDVRAYENDLDKYTGVWRSMVGFDLFRSLGFFRYIPGIHRSFHEQAWFISGQWLMENYWNNVANNICSNNDNIGTGITKEEADAFRAANPGQRAYPGPRCKRYRWNHLLTLVAANQGLFGSRLETRNAIVYEPRGKQYLLYTQNWWRNVLGYPSLELSMGVAWFPGSYMKDSWSNLQHYAYRDQIWFEMTYYLL